ncbi:MAG: YncE family protein, partial [Candidatus Binatia bacterium]
MITAGTGPQPWRQLAAALLTSLGAAAVAATAVTAASPAVPESAYFEHEGLRVELDARPLGGAGGEVIRAYQDVELGIRVHEMGDADKTVSGLQPLAWLTRREDREAMLEGEACKRHIRGLLAGRLARNADVNLNEYLLITLDDNNSLSIIDPQIESSKTKTLGIVSLASKGVDFVLAPDRRRVLVTLPLKGQVAEADIFERKARYLGVGGRPQRIALQPDGRFAWVGDETGDEVVAIDVDEFEVAARFSVGSGPHELAFAREEPRAFVIGRADRSVAIVDTRTLEHLGDVSLEAAPVAIAYSDHSRRAYVAIEGGTILVVDGKRREVSGTIRLPAPASAFAVSPDGRFGFAVHRETDSVTIVDTASDRIVDTVATGSEPHDIAFSDAFAYIQHAGTGQAVLIDLNVLSRGDTPTTAPVALGQRPPVSRADPTIAPTVVALPEGGGVLALNGADRSIYHFMEGMNAPMGAYQTYPWRARGVLLSDRTIREVDKGHYATEFQAPSAGEY